MNTKATLHAEMRNRRRARRAGASTVEAPLITEFSQPPIPVRSCAEVEGLVHQIRTLASSMDAVTLPTLFVPTPLGPDISLAFGLFGRALLPVFLDEAGAPLGAPRWGLWESGQALVTLGRPPAQLSGKVLGAESLKEADLIAIPGLTTFANGTRLGQGGGQYDRALTHRSPSTSAATMTSDNEVLGAEIVPVKPRDVPVDGIVTSTRVIAVNLR